MENGNRQIQTQGGGEENFSKNLSTQKDVLASNWYIKGCQCTDDNWFNEDQTKMKEWQGCIVSFIMQAIVRIYSKGTRIGRKWIWF